MDNAVKAILIGASVVIVMAIVTIGFRVLSSGQDVVDSSMDNLTNTVNNMQDPLIKKDDGSTIDGHKVLSYVKGELKDIPVLIKTGNAAKSHAYNGTCATSDHGHSTDATVGTIANLEKITATSEYINKAGKFKVIVNINDSGMINCVAFNQE